MLSKTTVHGGMHDLWPNNTVERMNTVLNRRSLATSRVVWLSIPAGLVLIAFLLFYMGFRFNLGFLEDERWAFFDILACPLCFICSSLALGHMVVAAGAGRFRVAMIALNLLGMAAAAFLFVCAGAFFLS
jgi:hypothetical protein